MRISWISMILAGCVLAVAQKKPIAGVPPAGTTGAPTGPSTNGAPPTPTPTTTSNVDANQRGPFFYGKVVMDDGTAPPSSVVIERVCNGSARPQAYPDSSGNFSFQVGQTQDMLSDASVERGASGPGTPNAGRGPDMAYNCDLRAALTGYRSDVVSLAGRHLDDANVGTITLHPLVKVEGLTTSATSDLAPKEAHKAFDKGMEAVKKSRTDEAQTEFMKAVQIYPRYASAWFELGQVYEKRQDLYMARTSYTNAIGADSKFVNPYERLYLLAFNEKKWKDTTEITERVMRLNPYDFPDSVYYNAVANFELGKLDLAEKRAREVIAQGRGTQNPKVYYVLGVVLAKKQDSKAAAECLRTYLKSDKVFDRPAVTKLLAEVEAREQAKAETRP